MKNRLTNPKHEGIRSVRFPRDEGETLTWWSRLAEFEDTGHTPDEIINMERRISELETQLQEAAKVARDAYMVLNVITVQQLIPRPKNLMTRLGQLAGEKGE